ncbi:uncharacterized protein MONOS_8165 [Monocercomonoides exilis]|uniref:uncharacterized protein n=1 Tax=Monocercomonoides exilis TaxID=2049356 RepID=UPI003559DE00|nr:hypothetical protein MONOS_8165 [Monocercomonoides exilis]|eukprot:MONOS_8165.1-p1 / transcript=MONOS_8165.1 / gene=MONOS_8165 / organism=Monocercomonoides_exilis_PA203 / gene_product=unspecified product / transcript_product=unspecified product / location=Mono_scaffold00299:63948-64540(+) / protein_length=171 / sequence_SO=supercontig / SO=protein_coding / is_pseudo=false
MFLEKFSQLEQFTEAVQKRKIEEIIEVIEELNNNELESIFNEEMFNKIEKMIGEKKMSMENASLLLKHVGCCKVLKLVFFDEFEESSLNERFEKMINEEEMKEEEKRNEKLLIDLCECYISLNYLHSPEIISICVPCLLKVAMRKEENEEIQKEVEMALLALSCFDEFNV